MRHRRTATTASLAALALAAAPLAAQGRPDAGAYVIMLGADTISIERFTPTAEGINHEQVMRSPQTMLRHTHLGVSPTGELGEIFVMLHQIERMDAPLLASTQFTMKGRDSATVLSRHGDSTVVSSTVAATADMIPMISNAFLPYEMAARRLRAQKADSIGVVFVNAAGQTLPVAVKRIGADSVRLTNPYYAFRAKVDREGRILGLAGEPGTPFQPLVTRVASVDIAGTAKAWLAKEKQGAAMGQLSPADSVRATVGGARIAIDYSRPHARGRTIWGQVVPYGQVWRTGANAATTLTTTRDLEIGGAAIPAGSYTLFTVPTEKGATLVVSKRTKSEQGQPLWGTDYKDDMDLARISMAVATLPAPVEQFTIALDPLAGDAGALRMRWGTREMSVGVKAKN
jgi:hypothetical protein